MTRIPITALEGTTAPPRRNGELAFDEPWQSRAFGMAVALAESDCLSWSDFSARLAQAISSDHADPTASVLPVAPDTQRRYYQSWLEALQDLLLIRGVVAQDDIVRRAQEIASGRWDHPPTDTD